MKVDQVGLDSIKQSEGVRSAMYRDEAGLPTIAVGHLLTPSELASGKIQLRSGPVRWADGLTIVQVDELLARDLGVAEAAVDTSVTVPLSQNQFNALVSFAFNVGQGAFAQSRLLRQLNAGDYTGVPEQLRRWFYTAGKPSNGLKRRREEEVRLWNLAS